MRPPALPVAQRCPCPAPHSMPFELHCSLLACALSAAPLLGQQATLAARPAATEAPADAFDAERYLQGLDVPTLDELIADLQPIPSIEKLLARLTALEADAGSDRAAQSAATRSRMDAIETTVASGDLESALAAADELYATNAGLLGPEHASTQAVVELLQELSAYVDWEAPARSAMVRAFQLSSEVSAHLSRGADASALAEEYLGIAVHHLPQGHPRVIDALTSVGVAWKRGGEPFSRAAAHYAIAPGSASVALGHALESLAHNVYYAGQFAYSEALARKSLELQLASGGSREEFAPARLMLIGVLNVGLGARDRGMVVARRAVELAREIFGEGHVDLIAYLNNLATLYQQTGQSGAALELAREVYALSQQAHGELHRISIVAGSNLATALESQGQILEAAETLRACLESAEQALSSDVETLAMLHNNLGHVLYRLRSLDEAEILLTRAVEGYRNVAGDDPRRLAGALDNLGGVLEARGDTASARILAEEALELRLAAEGERGSLVATSLFNMGVLCASDGDSEAAIDYLQRSLELRRGALPPGHPDVLASLSMLGQTLVFAGRLDEARAAFDAAAPFDAQLAATDGSRGADQLLRRAHLFVAQDDSARATELLESALELQIEAVGPDHVKVAGTWSLLGNAATRAADWERASVCFANAFNIVDATRTHVGGAEVERASAP